MKKHALVLGAVALLLSASSMAAERLQGPVPARVIAVIDGDTLEIEARIWLGHAVRIKVRLDRIDTPEQRSACAAEKRAAAAAKAYLAARVAGAEVRLVDVRYGKYAGRVLARVLAADGADVGAEMIAQGHARPYTGGRRRPWCDGQGRLITP